MNAVALKLKNGEISATDIINYHYSFQFDHKKVWFSTDIMCDSKRKLDSIVFCFKLNNNDRYVIANIEEFISSSNPFIPTSNQDFIPEKYKDAPKKTWFLITDMREIDKSFFNDCYVEYTNGESKLFLDVVESSPRLNRVYFIKKNDLDSIKVLIK